MNDNIATRRVCTAVIECALKDAEGRAGANRAEAIAWLASKDAALFLDPINIPQSSMLMRTGWREWAWQVIDPWISTDEGGNGLTSTQESVILDTLTYLNELEARQHANHVS